MIMGVPEIFSFPLLVYATQNPKFTAKILQANPASFVLYLLLLGQ
jgi:hypothetical protein